MQEFRCEYEEDGQRQVIRGGLKAIERQVGSRHVLLDGVPGHFERAEDEHATLQFVISRADPDEHLQTARAAATLAAPQEGQP